MGTGAQTLRLGIREEPDLCVAPPRRLGSRPKMSLALPHLQLDQWPGVEIGEQLIIRSLSLADVRSRESRMASPGSRALYLPEICARGPGEAFIDQNEFCHLHPLPEGSIHITLPSGIRQPIVELGWAERHPAARSGIMPETLVTVYAPRDRTELAVVLTLVWASCQFARGHEIDWQDLSLDPYPK